MNSINAQTIELNEFENGKNITSNENLVIVNLYDYKKDGYGQNSTLVAFDNKLMKKWEFKLDLKHTNIIDKVLITNNSIIFTGIEGERDNQTLNTNRFIRILDLSGKLLYNKNLGKSIYSCTNLLVIKNKLTFSYQKSSSIHFSNFQDKKTVFVNLDLVTKSIKFSESFFLRSTPEFNIYINNEYYCIGERYKTEKYNVTESYIKNISQNSLEKLIPAERMESISRIISSEKKLTLFSYSNPFIENQERYIRIDQIDFLGNVISKKEHAFSKLGWFHIYLKCTAIENEAWFYVFKTNEDAFFMKINSKGDIKEEIKSNIGDGSIDFSLNSENVFHLFKEDEKLKLIKLKR